MQYLDKIIPIFNLAAAVGVLAVAVLFKWKSKHKVQ